MPLASHTRSVIPTLVLAAALAGCDGQGPGGTTSLTVMLKDAPGDLEHAVVTVSEVDLMGSGGVHVLTQTPVTVDLLTLAADATTLLQGVEVPSGRYTELRFKITGACIAVDAGGSTDIFATAGYDPAPCGGAATGMLQSPSYAESGLKITMPSEALDIAGTQKILLVDFDVTQSFGHDTGTDAWVMHPVITGASVEVTGSVHVAVQLGDGAALPDIGGNPTTLAQFSAVLVQGTDTVATVPLADSDADGVFTADFLYMDPGSYALSFEPPAGITTVTTDPPTPSSIDLGSGQDLSEEFTVTAAN